MSLTVIIKAKKNLFGASTGSATSVSNSVTERVEVTEAKRKIIRYYELLTISAQSGFTACVNIIEDRKQKY